MEIDITRFFAEACPRDYSASVAEMGANAGPDTWRAAMDDSAAYPILDTEEKREAFRDYIRGFGAWSDAEISAHSDASLNALCIQFLAGDIREAGLDSDAPDWETYEKNPNNAGRIYRGDSGAVYFYCGS